jgi:hypothetical protein
VRHARTFLFFFAVQFLYYALVCWNVRVIAQARPGGIFISDLCIAAIAFTLIKKVANTDSRVAMAGYVLGGAIGSVISVWITKQVYGQ